MIIFLACKKEDKKDVLTDLEKVPDDAISSNVPVDPNNPPNNIKNPEGFNVDPTTKTNDGKKPEVTIDVSKVCYLMFALK